MTAKPRAPGPVDPMTLPPKDSTIRCAMLMPMSAPSCSRSSRTCSSKPAGFQQAVTSISVPGAAAWMASPTSPATTRSRRVGSRSNEPSPSGSGAAMRMRRSSASGRRGSSARAIARAASPVSVKEGSPSGMTHDLEKTVTGFFMGPAPPARSGSDPEQSLPTRGIARQLDRGPLPCHPTLLDDEMAVADGDQALHVLVDHHHWRGRRCAAARGLARSPRARAAPGLRWLRRG